MPDAMSFIIHNDLFDGRVFTLTYNATVQQIVNVIREFVPEIDIKFVDSQIMNNFMRFHASVSEGFTFSGNLRQGIGETIDLLRQ